MFSCIFTVYKKIEFRTFNPSFSAGISLVFLMVCKYIFCVKLSNKVNMLSANVLMKCSVFQPIHRSPHMANGHLKMANGFVSKYLKLLIFWTFIRHMQLDIVVLMYVEFKMALFKESFIIEIDK